MKHRLGILFLSIVSLVALAPSNARACGDHSDVSHVLKFHHHHEHAADHHVHTCRAANHVHDHAGSENDCPDDDCGKHCHCPGCGGNAGGGHASGLTDLPHFLLNPPPSEIWLEKQAFYFAEHSPEEVCLPIWQPPKLAA